MSTVDRTCAWESSESLPDVEADARSGIVSESVETSVDPDSDIRSGIGRSAGSVAGESGGIGF